MCSGVFLGCKVAVKVLWGEVLGGGGGGGGV